ncbi:hypothetical protein [Stieleria varia]|uniref:hypothetical protein n=1 Tax=Stieleria varia TaxID=2528005 RepID=UPI0018D23CD2|nr:hypothetical protein [Stieleria varia]
MAGTIDRFCTGRTVQRVSIQNRSGKTAPRVDRQRMPIVRKSEGYVDDDEVLSMSLHG